MNFQDNSNKHTRARSAIEEGRTIEIEKNKEEDKAFKCACILANKTR